MGIFSDNRLHTPAMDSRKLKDGPLKRYKSGLLGSKWKDCYAVLYSDSTLSWYDERGDSRPVGSVLLKDVVPYICVGILTDRMPIRRPSLPTGASVHHLVAIGMDPRAEKVHWLLFGSDADLESWFGEIVKTLPKPASPQPNAPGASGGPPPPGFNPSAPGNDFKPPAVYPPAPGTVGNGAYGGPPPYAPQGGGNYPQTAYGGGGNYPPPNGGYSQPGGNYPPPGGYSQPGPTTVIIDRDRGNYGGGRSSGFGGSMGLGTGLLGGALLGYGLGSFFQPHYHSGFGGFGGGFGGGYGGMGGGYSDNDTTINNYYNNTNNDSTTNNYTNDNVTSPEPNDTFGGGSGFDNMNDYNDYDGAGGDFGSGGDFGGMDDIGGGDFGGADFGDF